MSEQTKERYLSDTDRIELERLLRRVCLEVSEISYDTERLKDLLLTKMTDLNAEDLIDCVLKAAVDGSKDLQMKLEDLQRFRQNLFTVTVYRYENRAGL